MDELHSDRLQYVKGAVHQFLTSAVQTYCQHRKEIWRRLANLGAKCVSCAHRPRGIGWYAAPCQYLLLEGTGRRPRGSLLGRAELALLTR